MEPVYRKFTLVIPTLNEADNIRVVLDRATAALSQVPIRWEILVVDDSSGDGTGKIVTQYTESDCRVHLLVRPGQRGLAGAITYGWSKSDADLIGVMDADLQHPPELLPTLISEVYAGSDIAIASRYVQPHSMDAWNPVRKALSRLSVFASRPIQRRDLKVHDPMSGFFILRRSCIDGLNFQSAGFKLLLEILAKGHIRSVAEIPFRFGTRSGGKSKADGMTAVHYLALLGRLVKEKVFGRKGGAHLTDDSAAAASTGKIPTPDPPSPAEPSRSVEVILGLLPLVLGLQLLVWIVYLPVALRGDADFRAFYSAGYMLRTGQGREVYDPELLKAAQDSRISPTAGLLPYTHLPYEMLLFAPVSLFPYRAAYLIFLGLNLFCLLASYELMKRKLWRLRGTWKYFPFLLFIGFQPVAVALMQGQDSLVLLLLLAAAVVRLTQGDDLNAGFLLGLCLFRYQIVLPIGALFFFWRKWRFLGAGFASSLAMLGLSVLASGVGGLRAYGDLVYAMGVKLAATSEVGYVPIARMPNLRGLIFAGFHIQSGVLVTEVTIVVSVLVMALAAWAGRDATAEWRLAIAVTAAILVGYHVLTHDLSMLLIPMAMLLNQREARGLWSITAVWLATPLCFFARDYWIALPVLGILLVLVRRSREASAEPHNVSVEGQNPTLSRGRRAGEVS